MRPFEVLVTGYPNSGTSYMAELVHEFGFAVGPKPLLKEGDSHNPWGYWEFLPIRTVFWKALLGFNPMSIPAEAMTLPSKDADQIFGIARTYQVECYKDNALPLGYGGFPEYSKILVMTRNPRTLYDRYYARNYSWPAFFNCWQSYAGLVRDMSTSREVLSINYETFGSDLERAVRRVGKFVDKPFSPRLLKVYRRKRWVG